MKDQDWKKLLDEDPRDELLKKAWADWLDDEGRPLEAEAVREFTSLKRIPEEAIGYWIWYRLDGYEHYAGLRSMDAIRDSMAQNYWLYMIAEEFLKPNEMKKWKKISSDFHFGWTFKSAGDAYFALAKAWILLAERDKK